MFKSFLKACGHNAFRVLKRCKGGGVDPEILKKLDEGYDKLRKSNSKSLLKKHLTPELFQKLKTKRTKSSTLLDCIRSGLINHDSGCGIYASCPESYKVFAELFDPIIQEYHFGFKSTDKHPPVDFGDPSVFEDIDPNNHFIASTRIRCGRSIEGYPFNPCMTSEHYNEIDDKVQCALSNLKEEYKGKYYPLPGMDKAVKTKLINDHFLFKGNDRFLQAANASRHWPIGRGIYHNIDKTFLVWCNEEDHLRVISMQRGGNFGEVYARLIEGLCIIESRIPFARDDRLGYLTFCPTNLGTTIRASVHIKIPNLAAKKKLLEEVALKYKLQVRGTHGEHTKAEGGVYDISNRRRLGLTEYEAVAELYCGIRKIIKLEKEQMKAAIKKKESQPAPAKPTPQKTSKSETKDECKKKKKGNVKDTVSKTAAKLKTCKAKLREKAAHLESPSGAKKTKKTSGGMIITEKARNTKKCKIKLRKRATHLECPPGVIKKLPGEMIVTEKARNTKKCKIKLRKKATHLECPPGVIKKRPGEMVVTEKARNTKKGKIKLRKKATHLECPPGVIKKRPGEMVVTEKARNTKTCKIKLRKKAAQLECPPGVIKKPSDKGAKKKAEEKPASKKTCVKKQATKKPAKKKAVKKKVAKKPAKKKVVKKKVAKKAAKKKAAKKPPKKKVVKKKAVKKPAKKKAVKKKAAKKPDKEKAMKKETAKEPASKKQAVSKEEKSSAPMSKKKAKCLEIAKTQKKITAQSTDPCVRAGMKKSKTESKKSKSKSKKDSKKSKSSKCKTDSKKSKSSTCKRSSKKDSKKSKSSKCKTSSKKDSKKSKSSKCKKDSKKSKSSKCKTSSKKDSKKSKSSKCKTSSKKDSKKSKSSKCKTSSKKDSKKSKSSKCKNESKKSKSSKSKKSTKKKSKKSDSGKCDGKNTSKYSTHCSSRNFNLSDTKPYFRGEKIKMQKDPCKRGKPAPKNERKRRK